MPIMLRLFAPRRLLYLQRGIIWQGQALGIMLLFAGGEDIYGGYRDTVDAYNASLVRSRPAALSVGRRELAGASVGNYALFAGGRVSLDSSGIPLMPILLKHQ